MTISLPELPRRIASLPKDSRGYPIPTFIEWMKEDLDGVSHKAARGAPGAYPDFRYANSEFRSRAFKTGLCWICGQQTGVHKVYVLGPLCVINRTTLEPASHRDCATFAVRACPFLIRPRMRRLPFEAGEEFQVAGTMIERNPGCVCLYETREAEAFEAKGGWLIRLGKPDRVDWWAEGRQATRAEIQASIDGGYPLLLGEAMKEGQESVDELTRLTFEALQLLPAA